MIYSRFGEKVEVVRAATLADVRTFERRKSDREDRERTAAGYRAICRYQDSGKEFLADAAFLRADDGWSEVSSAFRRVHIASVGDVCQYNPSNTEDTHERMANESRCVYCGVGLVP